MFIMTPWKLSGKNISSLAACVASLFIGLASMNRLFMQFVGGSFKTMVHVEELFAVQQAIEEQQQESSDNLDYIDYDIIRKDGVIRHVADVRYKVFNGTEYVYYVYLVDVTELNIN